MSATDWRERLLDRMPSDLAEEIDIFEGQMELRRKGKIEDRVFAETRLPGLRREERHSIYLDLARVLAGTADLRRDLLNSAYAFEPPSYGNSRVKAAQPSAFGFFSNGLGYLQHFWAPPGLGALAARKFPIPYGHGRAKDTEIFVSRGVGTVYVPVRINCPPEVALVTLKPRSA